jgi:endogenous inhibitor of DNA gyrase (YacG/DUF329 family)
MRKTHTCPVCHKTIVTSDKKDHPKPRYFPFCSERCRLVDLGSWFDGRYKLNSPIRPDDNPPDSDPDND